MDNYTIFFSLLASVLLTGLITFLFTDKIQSRSKYINTFSAAVVAALIFVHILPEIYEVRSFWIGFALMIGMIFQLVLEKITKGIEHGHVHSHSHSVNHKSILWGLMIGLGIHSLVEGAPIFMSNEELATSEVHHHMGGDDHGHSHEGEANHQDSVQDGTFVTAILFHKVPVSIVFSLFLLSVGVKKWKFFGFILIFAFMTPLGGLLGKLLSNVEGMNLYTSYFMAFSTGMLLHIITAILFEHSHSKKESNAHLLITTLGVTLGTLIFYFQ